MNRGPSENGRHPNYATSIASPQLRRPNCVAPIASPPTITECPIWNIAEPACLRSFSSTIGSARCWRVIFKGKKRVFC